VAWYARTFDRTPVLNRAHSLTLVVGRTPNVARGTQISGDRFGMDLLLSSREAKAFGRTLGSTPALMPISKLYSDPAPLRNANAGAAQYNLT
jgi:hypothetical protein